MQWMSLEVQYSDATTSPPRGNRFVTNRVFVRCQDRVIYAGPFRDTCHRSRSPSLQLAPDARRCRPRRQISRAETAHQTRHVVVVAFAADAAVAAVVVVAVDVVAVAVSQAGLRMAHQTAEAHYPSRVAAAV